MEEKIIVTQTLKDKNLTEWVKELQEQQRLENLQRDTGKSKQELENEIQKEKQENKETHLRVLE